MNGSVGVVEGFDGTLENARTTNESVLDFKTHPPDNSGPSMIDAPSERVTNAPENRTVWPLVRFQNGYSILCKPERFEIQNARGDVEAARIQVPLILAWAVTIHKSQGMHRLVITAIYRYYMLAFNKGKPSRESRPTSEGSLRKGKVSRQQSVKAHANSITCSICCAVKSHKAGNPSSTWL